MFEISRAEFKAVLLHSWSSYYHIIQSLLSHLYRISNSKTEHLKLDWDICSFAYLQGGQCQVSPGRVIWKHSDNYGESQHGPAHPAPPSRRCHNCSSFLTMFNIDIHDILFVDSVSYYIVLTIRKLLRLRHFYGQVFKYCLSTLNWDTCPEILHWQDVLDILKTTCQ